MVWRERLPRAGLTLLLGLGTGCVLPTHLAATAGGSRGAPAHVTEPGQEPAASPGYNVRLGVHPLQHGQVKSEEELVELGVGYEVEHLPLLEQSTVTHGPFMELGLWPFSSLSWSRGRLGARVFAELILMEHDSELHGSDVQGRRVGYGSTLALAWEVSRKTRLKEGEDGYKYRTSKLDARYGLGLFAALSVRRLDDTDYLFAGIGGSLRIPNVRFPDIK